MRGAAGARELERGADALAFLEGTWQFRRRILGEARAAGTATVLRDTADSTGAEYSEVARVCTNGGVRLRATQRYRFCGSAEGFAVWREPAGELFQELVFTPERRGRWVARAVAVCGADRYTSMYALGPGRRFRVLHAVRGPRKQYVAYTVYNEA